MHYLGGKQRICHIITPIIQSFLHPNNIYIEPFVGSASILCKINHPTRIASDNNVALINMFKAISNGWEPPDILSHDEYLDLKSKNDPSDPLTAFAGIGCSFSGKWFGGYARSSNKNKSRNYALNAKNSLQKKFKTLNNVIWLSKDYSTLDYPSNAIIYCDPPYNNTTGYRDLFNTTQFFEFMRNLPNIVIISEYAAPPDFICIKEIHHRTGLHAKSPTRLEKLFIHEKHYTIINGDNDEKRFRLY